MESIAEENVEASHAPSNSTINSFKPKRQYFHPTVVPNDKVVHQIYPGGLKKKLPVSTSKSSIAFFGGTSKADAANKQPMIFQKAPKKIWGVIPHVEAKPTVTTLLRQNQLYAKKEKEEKEKMTRLLERGNPTLLDHERRAREKEAREQALAKAEEAKRLLKAKLAYEKAIAASRGIISQKHVQAEGTRKEVEKLKLNLREQKKQEIERRKALAMTIAHEAQDWKRAVKEVQKEKARTAQQLKADVQRLEAEAKQRDEAEKVERHKRIQQIQAAKVVMKRLSESQVPRNIQTANNHKMENKHLVQTKKAQEAAIENTRRKIQALKQEKMLRLQKARQEIEKRKNELHEAKMREETYKARSEIFPDYASQTSADMALMANNDNEIDQLINELQKWKTENAVARNQHPPGSQ